MSIGGLGGFFAMWSGSISSLTPHDLVPPPRPCLAYLRPSKGAVLLDLPSSSYICASCIWPRTI